MKNLIGMILLSAVFVFSGCSYSNWNISKDKPAAKHQPKQDVMDEPIVKAEPIIDQNIEQNITTPKDRANMFHINTVVSTWGAPNSVKVDENGDNNYIWKNCKKTGKYIDECRDDVCNTVPETACCDRVLITDKEGYVTNLKEAVANCM